MKAVLYVSRAALPLGREEREMAALVARARARNAASSLTGVLVFTGHHFAQWLEGPATMLVPVLSSIYRDPRHRSVRTVAEESVEQRMFQDWGLAYSGPSTYVDRRIRLLFHHADLPAARAELIELLRELAAQADAAAT